MAYAAGPVFTIGSVRESPKEVTLKVTYVEPVWRDRYVIDDERKKRWLTRIHSPSNFSSGIEIVRRYQTKHQTLFETIILSLLVGNCATRLQPFSTILSTSGPEKVTDASALNRRRFLIYAGGTAVVVAASAVVLYHASKLQVQKTTTTTCSTSSRPTPSTNVSGARDFLKNRLYNITYSLCREDPGEFSGRYWTCSDNMLAYRAFHLMGDVTYRDAIYNRLHSITIPCRCVANHDAAMNHLHDPIVHAGATIYDPPRSRDCYSINTSNWTASSTICPDSSPSSGVFHEDHCLGAEIPDYACQGFGKGYADLCFLEAISYSNQGNRSKANSLYQTGRNKWDSTKKGFNDKRYASSGYFDTYKLALCIIASKKVNCALPDIYSDLDARLAEQQGPDGGISSTYSASANRLGSENCETTAMTIIAYRL
jgi:hypothetical protein